jgi:hypothetical protein
VNFRRSNIFSPYKSYHRQHFTGSEIFNLGEKIMKPYYKIHLFHLR